MSRNMDPKAGELHDDSENTWIKIRHGLSDVDVYNPGEIPKISPVHLDNSNRDIPTEPHIMEAFYVVAVFITVLGNVNSMPQVSQFSKLLFSMNFTMAWPLPITKNEKKCVLSKRSIKVLVICS